MLVLYDVQILVSLFNNAFNILLYVENQKALCKSELNFG